MTGMSVDQIMSRVQLELARRRGLPNAGSADGEDARSFAPWRDIASPPEAKAAYELSELLAYSDRDFLERAYFAVLRRAPDAEGFEFHLGKLRSGVQTKVEILGELRWSPEGTAKSVHIDGLLLPFKLQQWKRKRFVGPIVAWVHGLLRVGSSQTRMAVNESRLARRATEIGAYVNHLAMEVSSALGELERMSKSLRDELGALNERHDSSRTMLDNLLDDQRDAVSQIADLRQALFGQSDDFARRIDAQVEALASEVESRKHAFGGLDAKLAALIAENEACKKKAAVTSEQVEDLAGRVLLQKARWDNEERRRVLENESRHALDPLYAAFEDEFRGNRALVRTRIEPYLEWVREVAAGTPDAPVLDIGCGRGEWLELLRDHGMIAQGIDYNNVFIEMCRGRGFNVTRGDAIDVLRTIPDGSIGAVTSMHLVEHLPFERMVLMFDEIHRVLRPEGLVILETPNPENLKVGSCDFYMDPTHHNPLPPEALRWIVEARGFMNVRVERLTHARELDAPPLLEEGVPGSASVNVLLASLNMAPDYAIVARRP